MSSAELTASDINEAKYRFEKAYRMICMGGEANAKAAIIQGYSSLGGDPQELIDDE